MDAVLAVMVQYWPHVLAFVALNFLAKWGRWSMLIKDISDLEAKRRAMHADGHLTDAEKAELFDQTLRIINDARSVAAGLFPNKSKVV